MGKLKKVEVAKVLLEELEDCAKVLRFYAKHENHVGEDRNSGAAPAMWSDDGKRARKALKRLKVARSATYGK